MNWDNATVVKFLELYQMNPVIWDPKHIKHKNRQSVEDAWANIKENLGVVCSVKDLKKKKESLMSAYRGYRIKIKKSYRSGSGTDQIYHPSWFAYPIMDSFLGAIYECNTTQNTDEETSTTPNEGQNTPNATAESNAAIIEEQSSSQHESLQNDSSVGQQGASSTITQPTLTKRRQYNPPELIQAKTQMNEAFSFMKHIAQQQPKKEDDECSTFGVLVAKKLRKLSEERRDIMMVKINQLFVEERYGYTSSSPQSTSTFVYEPVPSTSHLVNEVCPSPPYFVEEKFVPDSVQTAPIEEIILPNSIYDETVETATEEIIPNTIYEGSASSFKDLLIFKKKS